MGRIPRIVKTIVESIREKKGNDILIMDMKGLTITDYFVITTANSATQVGAIKEEIEKKMKLRGYYPLGVEGTPFNHWVVMDYGDIIVHIFLEEFRDLYDLEHLWFDVPKYIVENDGTIREK